MNLEEAIKTAIVYETKVRDVYREARDTAKSEAGVRIFKALAEEEELHLDYLNSRMREWKKDGKISAATLSTTIPSKETIEKEKAKLEKKVTTVDYGQEVEMLRKALDVEAETSNFYRKMANTLQDEGKEMFARFLEIEEGHLAIVKAELDCITGVGYWFDYQEFSMDD